MPFAALPAPKNFDGSRSMKTTVSQGCFFLMLHEPSWPPPGQYFSQDDSSLLYAISEKSTFSSCLYSPTEVGVLRGQRSCSSNDDSGRHVDGRRRCRRPSRRSAALAEASRAGDTAGSRPRAPLDRPSDVDSATGRRNTSTDSRRRRRRRGRVCSDHRRRRRRRWPSSGRRRRGRSRRSSPRRRRVPACSGRSAVRTRRPAAPGRRRRRTARTDTRRIADTPPSGRRRPPTEPRRRPSSFASRQHTTSPTDARSPS